MVYLLLQSLDFTVNRFFNEIIQTIDMFSL